MQSARLFEAQSDFAFSLNDFVRLL
jgi:hypothetical protein